jgi:hypothetical protein
LIAFVAFRFAFDIFGFISCSCVSTRLDFLDHSTSSSSLRFRHRPLRLRALAFDVSGVVSLAFDFKFLRIQFLFLPHRFVSLRSRLPWLRLPLSPSPPWAAVHGYLCIKLPWFRSVAQRCVSTLLTFLRIRFFSRSFRLGFDFFHLRLRIVSFRLACLRLHSTSTFLHISGRPVLRPQGGGVGHRRQKQTPKTTNKKKKKKKTATITTPQKRSRLIHSCSVQS